MALTFLSSPETPVSLIQTLLEDAIRDTKEHGKSRIEVFANADERNVLDVGHRLGFRCFLDPDDDHEFLLVKHLNH